MAEELQVLLDAILRKAYTCNYSRRKSYQRDTGYYKSVNNNKPKGCRKSHCYLTDRRNSEYLISINIILD